MKVIFKYSNDSRIVPYFWLILLLAVVIEGHNILTTGVNMNDV